jgi:hypothetical protein
MVKYGIMYIISSMLCKEAKMHEARVFKREISEGPNSMGVFQGGQLQQDSLCVAEIFHVREVVHLWPVDGFGPTHSHFDEWRPCDGSCGDEVEIRVLSNEELRTTIQLAKAS